MRQPCRQLLVIAVDVRRTQLHSFKHIGEMRQIDDRHFAEQARHHVALGLELLPQFFDYLLES